MSTINFVEGDGQPYITVTLTDQTGALIDLTGQTPHLTVRNRLGQTAIFSDVAMTVLNQTTSKGQAQYQPSAASVTPPGFYLCQVRVPFASGQMTFPNDETHLLLVIDERL